MAASISERSDCAQTSGSGSAALTRRIRSRGRPRLCFKRLNASKGDEVITLPKSKITVR